MSEILDVASCSVRTFYLLIGMVKVDHKYVFSTFLQSMLSSKHVTGESKNLGRLAGTEAYKSRSSH